MKKCLSGFIITIMIFTASLTPSEASGPPQTVIQFFEASQNGDVETMKQLIAGPFYQRRIVLIELNTEYPEFLKNFYNGASMKVRQFEIGNRKMIKSKHSKLFKKYHSAPDLKPKDTLTDESNEVAVVIVNLQFQNGSKINYKYLLQRTANFTWKIYDEILLY